MLCVTTGVAPEAVCCAPLQTYLLRQRILDEQFGVMHLADAGQSVQNLTRHTRQVTRQLALVTVQ
jgi:hypothetical protein